VKLFNQIMNRRPNYSVVTAHDPYLGLDMARSTKPDLICIDINLPGLGGYELFEMIRHEHTLDNCPVIAVSANAMPKDIQRGIQAGFHDYITKPFDVNGLLLAVDRALGAG
jgi:CheY-like chemotaxis protein